MLNRSNLTYLLYISSEIKQMHFCWDTDIENYVYFNSVQSSAWFNWGENVSLPSLVMTGARLLFFFFPITKDFVFTSLTPNVNHVSKPVISSAYPASATFFPACSVLCSLLSTPAPASLLYPAIFCGIISSVHFLSAWVNL